MDKSSCKKTSTTTSLMRTHNPKYARSEYHTKVAKMSFDKIFDLTAGVYFHLYKINTNYART